MCGFVKTAWGGYYLTWRDHIGQQRASELARKLVEETLDELNRALRPKKRKRRAKSMTSALEAGREWSSHELR